MAYCVYSGNTSVLLRQYIGENIHIYYDCLTFQAIENFALALKTTAQMLQTFGACLATTDLPISIPSTASVLADGQLLGEF